MLVGILLVALSGFAQTIDLSEIQKLDEEIPNYLDYTVDERTIQRGNNRKYLPPLRAVKLKEIENSGTQLGSLKPKAYLRDLEKNENYRTGRQMYVRYFNLEDEFGFKYIVSKDGTVKWRTKSRFIEPIKEELSLYVPPTRYTPAPDNIIRTEYDTKLKVSPGFSIYTGFAVGDYIRDLFEQLRARQGTSTQYGAQIFTEWKLPIKIGAAVHYERTIYQLNEGGKIIYSSPSVGPALKTREFELFGQPLRLQGQLRLSPFSRLHTEDKNVALKFNSADLMAVIERPIKNRFGEFVLGFFYQTQWLNLREQEGLVSVRATNQTNKLYGLSFGQVFE